jgi:putative acetyltransferase
MAWGVGAASSDETAAVVAVTLAAFGDGGDRVAGLVRTLVDERDAVGTAGALRASLVARDPDGEVVGHTALTRGWVDAERRLVELLVLSPLSVRPDRQGQGVGRSLVDAAVAEADRLGAPLVLLEGDPAYYGHLGFEPAAAHGLVPPSPRIPAPGCQVRLLPTHEPWMTGPLIYPDVFWRLDLVGLRS